MTNSIIKEVSIYRQGSYISRLGTIKVNKGKHNTLIDTLPSSLNPSTISLYLPDSVKGSNVQIKHYDESQRNEILKEINNKLTNIENKITIKQNQIELWNKNADFSNSNNTSFEQISNYLDNLPKRLEEIYQEINKLNDEKEILLKEKEEKEKQSNQYLLTVDMESDNDQDINFQIRYFDNNSYWYPEYEIHSDTNSENLKLLLKGKIFQNTIEDWNDIKVSLYTGNPNISLDIPKLIPNRLDFYQPKMMKSFAAGAARNFIQETTQEDIMPIEEEYEAVKDESGTYNQTDTMNEYILDNTYNIPPMNKVSVNIYTKEIPCTYCDIAIPKLDDKAYLVAKTKSSDLSELENSNALIYHNDAYLGELSLNIDLSEEEYNLSLGKDENIKLKRNEKKNYTSSSLLKSQKKTEYNYELIISSTKNKNTNIILLDQIPISLNKEIEINLNKSDNAKLNEENGQLKWEFDLEPKQEKKIEFSYTVSYPKDKKINI